MRKMPKDPTISSTSCLPYKYRNEYYLIFSYSDLNAWYEFLLYGYTHVALAKPCIGISLAVIEPLDLCAQIEYRTIYDLENMGGKILHLDVLVNRGSRLIKPTIQTCATLIQYLMGINLGVITCQSMYDRLVNKDSEWLRKRGVLGVKEWVRQQKD